MKYLLLAALFALLSTPAEARHHHRHHVVHHRHHWRAHQRIQRAGVSLAGVVAPLAEKVTSIVASCGSTVISAVRHTFVAGTRRISQHANGTAIDITGNPSCIYAMLRGWPGGYSTDYSAVRHVHISYGGREAGIRFVHGGHHRHRHRLRR